VDSGSWYSVQLCSIA